MRQEEHRKLNQDYRDLIKEQHAALAAADQDLTDFYLAMNEKLEQIIAARQEDSELVNWILDAQLILETYQQKAPHPAPLPVRVTLLMKGKRA